MLLFAMKFSAYPTRSRTNAQASELVARKIHLMLEPEGYSTPRDPLQGCAMSLEEDSAAAVQRITRGTHQVLRNALISREKTKSHDLHDPGHLAHLPAISVPNSGSK